MKALMNFLRRLFERPSEPARRPIVIVRAFEDMPLDISPALKRDRMRWN